MSQVDEDDNKTWTENDLKEAVRRINAGEINFKEAEDYYGISPRTIHRQRAIENMRAQLNPEKAKKAKSSSTTKKDVSVLRKPVDISCSSIVDVASLLNTGTEEVKQLLNHECNIIYECKVCKNLFRSLVNFISHKRIYCCDMYSMIHTQNDENEDGSEINDSVKEDEKLKIKDNLKEFSAKPFRITCRKDLTSILKRITAMSEFQPSEPILHLQNIENTTSALQQVILSNQPLNHDKSPKQNSNSNEILPSSLEIDSKNEIVVAVGKFQEKSDVTVKPVNYVAEKRFRCPVCPSNFTIKKSVMRHLKSVHDKSVEQLERLKPRIQMHYIRKKTSGNEITKEEKSQPIECNSKVDNDTSEQNKSNWEKECPLCERAFINRNSYAAHIKACRKNTSLRGSSIDSSETAKKKLPLVPVVSLTPIATPPSSFPVENDDVMETSLIHGKKLAAVSSQSKKVSLPSSTLSSSKKIGIQVRMNYHKENFNQANSINGASTSHAPSSLANASTNSSANNSRRNSLIIDKEVETDSKSELLNDHNTRSTDKLANVLERLLDKHNLKKIDKSEEDDHTENESTRKQLAKNEVSVYCEDCKTMFALNEYKCNVESKIPRKFRCALRNCDFRCTDSSELLPHLSAKHAIMSEGELAEVDSTFIAESTGVMPTISECGCSKMSKNVNINKLPELNATKVNLNNPPNSNETICSEIMQNKRKISIYPSKQILTKRKSVSAKESSSITNRNNSSENKISTKREFVENISKNDQVIEVPITKESPINEDVRNMQENEVPFIKKLKKVKNENENKIKTTSKTIVPVKNVTLLNGVTTSDEEIEIPQSMCKSKSNCNISVRKQNSNFLPTDTKIMKSSAKGTILNDFPSSSLIPDSDIDPNTMSEESLKKSIMTIIFGKDVPTEKIEGRISNDEGKSPTFSSTSSECGKEKRYSVRIAKQTSTKTIPSLLPPSVCKDDKVLKMPISNKLKASR